METSEMIKLAHEYMKVWSANQDDLLEGLAQPDLEVDYSHFDKACKGIPAFRRLLQMTYNHFPDLSIEIHQIIPAGNLATVRWQYEGTHREGVLYGASPAGKRISVCGISILEIKNGRVAREYGVVDNLPMLIEIGALSINEAPVNL